MKWYSFRKRKLDLIIPIPHYYGLFNKKTIGTEMLYLVAYEKGWHHDLILQDDFDRAGEFLFDELKGDKDSLRKRLKKSRGIAEKFLMFCKDKLSDTDKYDNIKLLELLEKFYKFYQEFSIENIPPWLFLADKLHKHILGGLNEKDANKVYTILSTPNTMTYIQREESDVFDTAIRIKQGEKADIRKLAKHYFWIPFDYTGPVIWDEEYYKKRIKELLSFDIDALKKQKDEIINHHMDLKNKQKKLIDSLKLSSEIIELFEAIKDIAILQDEKKAVTTESHYYL